MRGRWTLAVAGLLALAIVLPSAAADRPTAGASGVGDSPPPAYAERIYVGGAIVTVDAGDRVAEALAIADGKVLAVGPEEAVRSHQGPATTVIDLGGKAILPGFIDSHGHISQVAALAAAVNVASPPVGRVESLGELQAALREHIEAQAVAPGSWVLGAGYDDSLLREQRHPTRFDLDEVSREHPIALVHVSLHLATANSRALELMGVTAETPDPKGGVFRRVAGSREPDGVMEEGAVFALLGALPAPGLGQRLALLDRAQALYAAAGVTTAQDGATTPVDWQLLRAAADQGRLVIDVVAYPLWRGPGTIASGASGAYQGRLRQGGMKILLDGSPQGKTAWLSQPYFKPPPGQPPSYRGYPLMTDAEVEQAAAHAYERKLQLLAHANGDAAAEQLLRTLEKLPGATGGDRRPVMIHAQTVRDDQLDRMTALGMVPSFFVSHTFYWGDWHRDSVLGLERAARISPAASAGARGVRFTFHDDPPVVPESPLRLVWSGTTRTTRSGRVLGPDQRVDVMAAIRAVTIDAAYQYFEEDRKGSIEPGKLADLVILSKSPLEVDLDVIRSLGVLETLKEGRTIHRTSDRAPEEASARKE